MKVFALLLVVLFIDMGSCDGSQFSADLPSTALHSDDECRDGTPGQDSCGLVALQVRRSPAEQVSSKKVVSWEQLKSVVEASSTGENIHIPKGVTLTFKGTININEGTAFDIWSEGAVLDGQNVYGRVRMFYVRGSLNLTGLLLKNGKTDYAGAAYFDFGSTGHITNCSFRDNEATYMGGAVVAKGASISLHNVGFHSNSAKNTCLSALHCSRRRRNGRRANAVYVLSHTKFEASMHAQAQTQDIFFDKDFDGQAVFRCARPRLEATDHRVARHHVHMASDCDLTPSNV